MKIVIDLQGAQSTNSKDRGIGRYSLSITKAIAANAKNDDIHIVLNDAFLETIAPLKKALEDFVPLSNIHIFRVPHGASFLYAPNDLYEAAVIVREAFIQSLDPDIILLTSFFEGFNDDAVTSVKNSFAIPTAVILYDLIPLIRKKPYLDDPNVKKWYEEKIEELQKADLLLCISDSSKNEAIAYLDFFKKNIINISSAHEEHFKVKRIETEEKNSLLRSYGLKEGFIMYTGGIDHRKNIEGLIEAYGLIPEDIRDKHQLAIVCSIQEAEKMRLLSFAKTYMLQNDAIIFTGFVPEEHLIMLYNLCKVFVFPSLHEGFGLPVLEAMSCGKAVVGSNTSSIPEVIGCDEALFDPLDREDIASKLTEVLTDDGLRRQLEEHALRQAKIFSWDVSAIRAIEAMNKLYQETPKTKPLQTVKKKKLAYLSPLPPQKSGISDYSRELLPVLSKYYDIELITDQKECALELQSYDFQVKTLTYFQKEHASYDRILYHIGNSRFHSHMLDLLYKTSGVVVLHDFYLGHLQEYCGVIDPKKRNLSQALFDSHGYRAFQELKNSEHIEEIIWKYPLNIEIFQNAIGQIVHSRNAKTLTRQWYGEDFTKNMAVIPHLRVFAQRTNKQAIKQKLGFEKDDFIIGSFGLLGKTKRNLDLLDAFAASKLAEEKNVFLIFAGENDPGAYGANILKTIKKYNLQDRVRITGWVDEEEFKNYLLLTDVAVQLRRLSRGETSGTVLDCMHFAIPTIVNANGSMAELPKDAVFMLEDDFSQIELRSALEDLYDNAHKRYVLAQNAQQTVKTLHDPQRCAQSYYEAIEKFYEEFTLKPDPLYKKISQINHLSDAAIKQAALSLSNNHPKTPRFKQLFVDLSVLVTVDAKSGIQRAVKNILMQLLLHPPEGYAIQPVYAATNGAGYYYAKKFTFRFLNIAAEGVDTPIDFASGDLFLGVDFAPHAVAAQASFYTRLRAYGVSIMFVLYDLLPLYFSDYFEEETQAAYKKWFCEIVRSSDKIIAISQTVAKEAKEYRAANDLVFPRGQEIVFFHLGSDPLVAAAAHTPKTDTMLLAAIKANPVFLSVGTLEPRKGYEQTLRAFEILWQEGYEIHYVIVGKQGWKMQEFAKRLQTHPQRNKKLFWVQNADDALLQKLYENAQALIAASYGEGFGLPIVEAAKHNLELIVRDIAVFKEVASEHAYYFCDHTDPSTLAESIKEWLRLYENDSHPKVANLPWLTWEESARMLQKLL